MTEETLNEASGRSQHHPSRKEVANYVKWINSARNSGHDATLQNLLQHTRYLRKKTSEYGLDDIVPEIDNVCTGA
jgi:hypothetical protein